MAGCHMRSILLDSFDTLSCGGSFELHLRAAHTTHEGRLHAMATLFSGIDENLRAFIEDQPLFFVGTAPSGDDGLVNVSPKGYRDSFAVLDEHTVAYLDLFGSGAETIAHLKQNGRIVVMFCSF